MKGSQQAKTHRSDFDNVALFVRLSDEDLHIFNFVFVLGGFQLHHEIRLQMGDKSPVVHES